MGQTLIAAILGQQDMKLAAALEVADSPLLGHDVGGPLGQVTGVVIIPTFPPSRKPMSDRLPAHAATVAHVKPVLPASAVVGTTGPSEADKKRWPGPNDPAGLRAEYGKVWSTCCSAGRTFAARVQAALRH
jgi:dihydrodipicolinate reductase